MQIQSNAQQFELEAGFDHQRLRGIQHDRLAYYCKVKNSAMREIHGSMQATP